VDLNDVWQNHKRFLLGIGGGAVAFLIGTTVIASTWNVKNVKDGVARRAAEIRKIEAPTQSDLTALVNEVDGLKARLDALYGRMRYETRSEFLIPANESPDLFFNRRRDEVSEKLVGDARRKNIHVKATLGLPEFTPSGSEAIQRYLRALDLVEHVVSSAVAAGVRGVDDIEVRDAKSSSRAKAGAFLDPLAVKFTISGNTAAIASLLDTLTAEAEIAPDPKRANLTVLRLVAAALTIQADVQLTEARK
jgi:hypothetical protein